MGDRSDASFELFGDTAAIHAVAERFGELADEVREPNGAISYVLGDLPWDGEEAICVALRAAGVAYEFLQMGDYEYEPRLRIFHPEVPERFGDGAVVGEWRGSANADGEPLVPASVIDRVLTELPTDAADVWLTEQLELASAARWRGLFAAHRSAAASTSEKGAGRADPR